jgi:hypothetical protein
MSKRLSHVISVTNVLLVATMAIGGNIQPVGADAVRAPQAPAEIGFFQGRVYAGDVGDDSQPLEGVTVSVYGSTGPYPDSGTLLDSTTTDATGWYSLTVAHPGDIYYGYYHVIETDPEGYISAGAASISGTVRSSNWIEFAEPLGGQTYTGNQFWDQVPMLSGHVYEGEVGDESQPLEGVTISLFGGDNPYPDVGGLVDTTTTDATGWYELEAWGGHEFYHIFEADPLDYVSAGATTVDGEVITDNWIEYTIPLEGKTLTGNKFWDQYQAPMPDLLVLDVWSEGDAICYEVTNVGNVTAPGGHITALLVDGDYVESQLIEPPLESFDLHSACFDYEWDCTPPEDVILVEADYGHDLAEGDESNNALEETWFCDFTPPQIVSGPTVLELTPDSATISWETDEISSSMVKYTRTAGEYDSEETDPTPVLAHAITLSGLSPSATYRFTVYSADAAGNSVGSKDLTLQTPSVADSVDPSVSLTVPDIWQETATIAAQASDNTGVEKVEFSLDGDLVFTDYSSPYEFDLDTTEYENHMHVLGVTAHDLAGRTALAEETVEIANLVDTTPPQVGIISPTQWARATGQISVTAIVTDDKSLGDAVIYVDGIEVGVERFPPDTRTATVRYNWNSSQESNGNHRIGVKIWDLAGKTGLDTVDVIVDNYTPPPPPQPRLVIVGHGATRFGNSLVVSLAVKNVGMADAKNIYIRDFSRGFQPLSHSTTVPVAAKYQSRYSPSNMYADCGIADYAVLAQGASRSYDYRVVPILIHPNPPAPSIGFITKVWYEGPDGIKHYQEFSVRVVQTTGGELIATAHANATKSADYLIVTNPQRLFWNYGGYDVDDLLSEMAQLAVNKLGVLGYLGTGDRLTFDNLIEPGGDWAKKMHPDFSTPMGGYLLIVGETEIVPAWPGISVGWGPVEYSDHPYADTGGAPSAPDLIVGRIIGDSAAVLIKPIQASNGVYTGAPGYAFDRDNATLISGPGFGTFVQDIEDVATILQGEFAVKKVHTKDYFPVSSFPRDYQQPDGFAVGNVRGDAKAEIIIADASADKIYVYAADGTQLDEFYCGFGGNQFEAGDKIAVGNSNIVMADHSANRILVYSGYGILHTSFALDLEPSDDLALGDVVGGGYDEIVIADSSADKVYFYTLTGVKLTEEVWQSYDQHDHLAVGDVLGGARDEIVITDRSANKLLIYSAGGSLQGWRQFGTKKLPGGQELGWLEFIDYDTVQGQDTGGSALAVGHLYPLPGGNDSGKEEILIAAAWGYRHIHVFWWDAAKNSLEDAAAIPFNFDAFDGLAAGDVGDILGRKQDEVFVADRSGTIRTFDTDNWVKRFHTVLPGYTRDADVIYLSGHGNVRGCCGLDSHRDFPLDFNNHTPVVMATSCRTGNYQDDGDTKNVAESFLNSGAAIYIGSTHYTHGAEDTVAVTTFFKTWQASESIGEAFTGLERLSWGKKAKDGKNYWKYWVWEYNLYGDPKFGVTSPAGDATTAPALTAAPMAASSLQVNVPDYVVTAMDGLDRVEIPGGRLWLEEGDLWIPFYTTAVDYPQGYEIQDVLLVERSGLVTDTGLHLPMTPLTLTGCACVPEPYGGNVEGWFPEEVYDWAVLENPDGTSVLVVTMYPFYYNTLTTDVEFYKEYTFEIVYTVSAVAITDLSTDKAVYAQGDVVTVNAEMDNGGVQQDVVVSVLVKRYGTDQVVDGLSLETLTGFVGTASFSPQWDTSGFAPGNYYAEVTLSDTEGNILDRQTEMFGLGIASIGIDDLTATPQNLNVGDSVNLSLVFGNDGTVSITGTAVIRILDNEGRIVEESRHDFAGLAPGNASGFDSTWDATGAAGGTYNVVGYVMYDSMTTDPMTAIVSARSRIYLPLVLR